VPFDWPICYFLSPLIGLLCRSYNLVQIEREIAPSFFSIFFGFHFFSRRATTLFIFAQNRKTPFSHISTMIVAFHTTNKPSTSPVKVQKTMKDTTTAINFKARPISLSPACYGRFTSAARRCPAAINDRDIPSRRVIGVLDTRSSIGSCKIDSQSNIRMSVAQDAAKIDLRRCLVDDEDDEEVFHDGAVAVSHSYSYATPDACVSNSSVYRVLPDHNINTTHTFSLAIPQVLQDEALHLVSCTETVRAVAVGNTVRLLVASSNQTLSIRNDSSQDVITSIKWSESGRLLAFGTKNEVQIWEPFPFLQKKRSIHHQSGFVTALQWNGDEEIVAATQDGVFRYNLRLPIAIVAHYELEDPNKSMISSLEWKGEILAASIGNWVWLWDARRSGRVTEPFRKLRHENIKTLEFSPLETHSLATGGSDGIKLWNVHQIAPLALIPTEAPVTSLLWSPFRTELMAAYGDRLGVWKVTNEDAFRLADLQPSNSGGRVLALDRVLGTGGVVSLHSKGLLMGWDGWSSEAAELDTLDLLCW
jgi:WD40 repeat protein